MPHGTLVRGECGHRHRPRVRPQLAKGRVGVRAAQREDRCAIGAHDRPEVELAARVRCTPPRRVAAHRPCCAI
eukprot:3099543-Prymnesium_polylepis.1